MRHMKKLTAFILSALMLVAMAIPAFAADDLADKTITIATKEAGHTYEAYQIFTGTMAENAGNNSSSLANPAWGANVDQTKLNASDFFAAYKVSGKVSAEKVVEALNEQAPTMSAAAFASAIADCLTGTPAGSSSTLADVTLNGEAAKGYVITVPADGYYLVKDQKGSLTGDNAYTAFILKVIGKATANPKADKPTVEKKVWDVNDSEQTTSEPYNATTAENGTNRWWDSADYDIGDNVPFYLHATMPTNLQLSHYKTYKIVFHDTMSEGLTFNAAKKVIVSVNGTRTEAAKEGTPEAATAAFTYKVDGQKLTVSCADIKTADGISLTGSTRNEVYVYYYATLNDKAKIGAAGNENTVYLEYSNNPNWDGTGVPGERPDNPGETPEEPTGNTPEDKVVVFTYKVEVDKTDGSSPLAGANFALFKKYPAAQSGKTAYASSAYITDGTPAAVATKMQSYDGKNYYLVGAITATNLTTFEFKGIDDGEYILVETKAPEGYNMIAPVELSVTTEHDKDSPNPTLTNLEVNQGQHWEATTSTGIIETTVVNNPGATLPSTGGIGTTIFYVLGGVLVVGASVLLITKKRMGAE